jgi:prepilin-type N-terminal cleavage/methylation domain-containing protein
MNIKTKGGFTLIEILVVIGIVAVLAVVAVLAINPAQLLMQSRDSNRISSLSTISNAVAFAKANGVSLGTPNIAYVSIPDPTLTGNATSTCASLGLPAIASTTYQCVSPANLTNNNGTGWIPITFNTLPGSPLGSLPVDPTNTTSSNEYFVYTTNGTGYEVMADPEAAKDASNTANFENGSTLALLTSFPGTGSGGGPITFTVSTYAIKGSGNGFGYGGAFDSHTNTIWMTDPDDSTVTQINDTAPYATSTYLTGPNSSAGLVFDSNTKTIWVANSGNGTVTQINDTAPYATSTIAVGFNHIGGIAFDSHTNTIWVTAAGGTIATQINDTAPYATTTVSAGTYSYGIVFDSQTNTLWVDNSYAHPTITQINDTAPYATTTYAMGGSSASTFITFDSHTNTIWVANWGDSSVSQINGTTYTTSTTYGLGLDDPVVGIGFDPHTNSVWVGNINNTITQINDTAPYATTTYAAGQYPYGVTFDSHNNSIWFGNSASGTVTQLVPSR